MKILAIEKKGRLQEKTDPAVYAAHDITYIDPGSPEEDVIAAGKDAEVIIVDAMGRVSRRVIDAIPTLKMIHSDGVGFQGVDADAAREKGIFVCNCKGMNASAVAEQALMLMLGLLRNVIGCNRAVYEGRQIEVKENYMLKGNLTELADCTVGLYGFGDIAKILAKYVTCMGAKVLYYDVFRAPEEVEKEYQVTYTELDELCAKADILSVHVPVTPTTEGCINKEFFSKMKKGSLLINTARGELVITQDLIEALRSGQLGGAGLDTIAGEPVTLGNPITKAEPEVAEKMILSCHIGGITNSSFVRGFGMLWDDIACIERGERPGNIVNKL